MPQYKTNKTVLITGSSSGIGFLTTVKYAREGYTVYASTRKMESEIVKNFESLSKTENIKITPIYLDLVDHKSIEDAVQRIINENGKIDILINNAGYGYYSAVEDIDTEEFSKQFETNVIGIIKIMQTVIPHMRRQKKGLIINISSVMGFSTMPLNSPYASSKHALECISETLAFEVKPFGIDVVIVQPGGYHTNFIKNSIYQKHSDDSPYIKFYKRKDLKKDPSGGNKKNPEEVADLLLKISKTKKPRLRYMIGREVPIIKLLRTFLVDGLWIKFLRFFYKW